MLPLKWTKLTKFKIAGHNLVGNTDLFYQNRPLCSTACSCRQMDGDIKLTDGFLIFSKHATNETHRQSWVLGSSIS